MKRLQRLQKQLKYLKFGSYERKEIEGCLMISNSRTKQSNLVLFINFGNGLKYTWRTIQCP